MTEVPSVAGTTYSSVLVYDGSPQCSRNYLLFCPRLRRESIVQQELLTLLFSSTTEVPSVAGTTYSSVLVYDGGPQCSRNYLLFCPRLPRGSLVQQELLTLLPSSTTGVPSVAGITYSSVIVYDGGPLCSRNYILFYPRLRRGPQCIRNYLLFCPRLRRGSLVQQELYTLLSSSTTGVPSVAGTIYSSVLVYDALGPQCSRSYLLFCPRLRRGPLVQQKLLTLLSSSTTAALVQQELFTLLYYSTTGVTSVAGTTYSSVLVYDGGPQCSRNYILLGPRLRRGSLVQQELYTLLSSSTTGALVQQELLTLLSSSTTAVHSVAGATYSSVLVCDEGPQCSRNYLLFCPRLRRRPQCSRNYLLFRPRLRRESIVQQELLTLLSSSTTRVPSVAGTTYSSVLVYDGGPQCSRNYLLFCPRLRRGPQYSKNYLLFCPRLPRGSLVQQELLTLLSSSMTGAPSVAGNTYSSVLV